MAEDRPTSHRRSPLKHVRLIRQRVSGSIEHSGPANQATKKLRPLLLPAIIVLSITVIGLHVVGGFLLLRTGMGSLSLPRPLAYLLIGLLLVFAVLKLTHVVGIMHRKEKKDGTGED